MTASKLAQLEERQRKARERVKRLAKALKEEKGREASKWAEKHATALFERFKGHPEEFAWLDSGSSAKALPPQVASQPGEAGEKRPRLTLPKAGG